MSIKLLTEHYLECLSFKGGCTCSSESTLVKIGGNQVSRLKCSDININELRTPFRKDRMCDGHGGVAAYLKSEIPYIRRRDL